MMRIVQAAPTSPLPLPSAPFRRPLRAGRLCSLVFGLLCGALLTACSKGESEASLLEAARVKAEQRDTKAALIHLRNALQKNPDSAAVRLAMAKVLLDSGDAAAAAVELDKALTLRAPEDEVVPALARALLLSGEGQKVVTRFADQRLSQRSAQADLLSTLSMAQSQAGRQAAADQSLDQALATDPDSAWALVLLARRQATTGRDIEAALKTLQRAEARHPDKAQVHHLEGELLLIGRRDEAAATRAFEAALQARRDHVPAHASLVSLALQKNDLDAAKQRMQAMSQAAPRAPLTLLLQGRVALAQGQLDAAEQTAQQLLRSAPEDARVLLLAGEVALRKGANAQAETHLGRAVQRAPEALPARKMLAQLLLKSGEDRRALQALQPAIDSGTADGAAYALAAQAHLKQGQAAKAQEYFRKAAQLSPDNPTVRTAAALSQVKSRPAEALGELERIAAGDPGTTADLAVIASRLQAQDWKGAMEAVRRLERKQPDKPLAANLEGRILLAQGKRDEAAAAFERALRIDPGHVTSAIERAHLDAAAGRVAAAQSRLENLARQDGRQLTAWMALADLKARHGGTPQEIDELLVRAVKAVPDASEARLALIAHRTLQQDRDGALKAAQDAANALPQNPRVLEALGRAESSTGLTQQAIGTLRKAIGLDPQNPSPAIALAEIQSQAGDRAGARQTLRRALDAQPEALPLQRSLIALELLDGRREDATQVARQVQRQRPREPIGFLLEGDVAMNTQGWEAAAKAYRNAQQIEASTEGAIKLLGALQNGGRKGEAAAHAAEWERSHPKDLTFTMHLGQIAAAQGQWADAEKHYQRADRLQPNNPMILNNLAYAMARQSKAGAASVAQRANALLPDKPALMDTLALALAAEKKLDKAVEIQRRAVEKAGPSAAEFRLNLARIYLKAGDKASARQELQALTSLGNAFAGQRQVRELLESI